MVRYFLFFLRTEFKQVGRWVSPLLFSCVLLLLFWFASPKIPRDIAAEFVLFQTLIAGFLATQLYLLRGFEQEYEDGMLKVLLAERRPLNSYFSAKLVFLTSVTILILVCNFCLAMFFYQAVELPPLTTGLVVPIVLNALGLSSVGTLVSAMTIGLRGRHLLFPLIFFPLVTPVMIGGFQSLQSIWVQEMGVSEAMSLWLGFVAIFAFVYTMLALVLTSEIFQSK